MGAFSPISSPGTHQFMRLEQQLFRLMFRIPAGFRVAVNHRLVYYDFGNAGLRWNVVHGLKQYIL